MQVSEWKPTAYLKFVGGVLHQKFARECTEYREERRPIPNATWVEHEWRPVESEPSPDNGSTSRE